MSPFKVLPNPRAPRGSEDILKGLSSWASHRSRNSTYSGKETFQNFPRIPDCLRALEAGSLKSLTGTSKSSSSYLRKKNFNIHVHKISDRVTDRLSSTSSSKLKNFVKEIYLPIVAQTSTQNKPISFLQRRRFASNSAIQKLFPVFKKAKSDPKKWSVWFDMAAKKPESEVRQVANQMDIFDEIKDDFDPDEEITETPRTKPLSTDLKNDSTSTRAPDATNEPIESIIDDDLLEGLPDSVEDPLSEDVFGEFSEEAEKPKKKMPFAKPIRFSQVQDVDDLGHAFTPVDLGMEDLSTAQRAWRRQLQRPFKHFKVPTKDPEYMQQGPSITFEETRTVALRREHQEKLQLKLSQEEQELQDENDTTYQYIEPKMNRSFMLRMRYRRKMPIFTKYFDRHYEKYKKPPFDRHSTEKKNKYSI